MPTITEINPQVGDVVEYMGGDFTWSYTMDTTGLLGKYTYLNPSYFEGEKRNCEEFRVVSRAKLALQVGEEYTSRNGNKWKAIYEEGSKVWMKQLHGGPAYSWNKNGEASCLGEGFYNVNLDKQGPVVLEGVDVLRLGGVIDTGHSFNFSFSQHKATVTTIDGEPDWTTLKVVEGES